MHKLFLSPHILRLIDLALDEDDLGFDVASSAFFAGQSTHAVLRAKEPLCVAGLNLARAVFQRVDPDLTFEADVHDGHRVDTSQVFARIHGDAISLLRAERTALNFLQRMSGIATLTRRYVDALGDSTTRIVDTRKTLPAFRELDKYAVRCGGGTNHRFSLASGVMIKDNHIAAAGSVADAVRRARQHAPHTLKVEVEVERFDQIDDALDAGADIIMLDNMSTELMRRAVQHIRQRQTRPIAIEASGNITLERLPELAHLGLDYISSGALTHSVHAADISMKIDLHAP